MKLPKRDLPEYTAELPLSGKEFTYRPYTVKEDKVLMMAAAGDNPKDKLHAVRQIVGNCTDLDISALHPTDFEWVFLQLRKVSVSPIVELVYNVGDGQCGLTVKSKGVCPSKLNAHFNINDVIVDAHETDEDVAKPAKDGGWVISLGDNSSIHLSPTMPSTEGESLLYGMVKSIIDDGNVIPKSAFTEEEFETYLDENTLPSEMGNVLKFITSLPVTRAEINTKCTVCNKTFTYEASGLIDFLV